MLQPSVSAWPRWSLPLLVISLFAARTVSLFAQGSLTPPGAPAPTMKTLDQVEPRKEVNTANTPGDGTTVFRISQPGSYYLSGNVAGASGKNGIEITAGGVTLDLNGFTLTGGSGSLHGISTPPGPFLNHVTIRNGHLRSWGGSGITSAIDIGRIEHITAANNGGWGIDNMTGTLTTYIVSCSAIFNGVVGGTTGGIRGGPGSVITNCAARSNSGFAGITAGAGSTISGCIARVNTVDFGIRADSTSVIHRCSATGNSSGSAISFGIFSLGEVTVKDCTASGNSSSNGTPTGTTGGGINVGNSSTVSDCTVTGNKGDGILVTADSRVANNNCDSNGAGDGAGIHVTSSDNRIEGNNVTDNVRGIDVDVAGNLIIKNSASGNTVNYDIAASNVGFYVTATTTAAVSGSSGGTTVGTTDPWANFSY